MKHCVAALLLVAVGCGGGTARPADEPAAPVAPAPEDDGLGARIDALVEPAIAGEWLHAVSIAVIEPGRVRTFHYGHVAGPGSPAPDDQTLYEIGSLTKVFTGLVLADMVTRGEVTLDTPVTDLLPEVEVATYEGQPITLENLATHRSGWPSLPASLEVTSMHDPYAGYQVADLYRDAAQARPDAAPGARYAYSNFGFGLLGHALGQRAGSDWATVVRERILGPIGMKETRVELGAAAARLAAGHDAGGEPMAPWRFTDALAAAGALRSTLPDIVAFVQANIAGRPQALAEAMRLARTPRADIGTGQQIGLGWMIDPDGFVWHNGETGGYHSFAGFDPERGTGVVVLTSTAYRLVDKLAVQVREAMAGGSPTLELPTVVAVAPEVLARYVGRYSLPLAGLEVEVVREDDRLYVQPDGQPRFRIFPESETRFRLRVVEAAVEFAVDDDGRVTGIYLEQNGARIPGVKMADEDQP